MVYIDTILDHADNGSLVDFALVIPCHGSSGKSVIGKSAGELSDHSVADVSICCINAEAGILESVVKSIDCIISVSCELVGNFVVSCLILLYEGCYCLIC